MNTFAPKISLIVWSLWTLQGILVWIRYHSAADWTEAVGDLYRVQFLLGVQLGGIAVSLLLCITGLRIFALLLVPLSLYACWHAFLGVVIFKMLPAMGGVSFTQAMVEWWQLSTATPWTFVKEVPFALFLFASVFFWPLYALGLGSGKGAKSTAPWV